MNTNAAAATKLRKKPLGKNPNGASLLTIDIPEALVTAKGWNNGDELEICVVDRGLLIRPGLGKCSLCGGGAIVQIEQNKLCQVCIDKIAALKKSQV